MAADLSIALLEPCVRDQHLLIFQAWRCVLGDARVTYLSGPITTGARWVDAVMQGRADTARDTVIAANNQALLEAAARLRATSGTVLIEPASFAMPGWSQTDYLVLWTGLIEQHAGEVRFLPDWPLSNGCAHEFERALGHDIPTRDLVGNPISREQGAAALGAAHRLLVGESARRPVLAPLRDAIGGVLVRLG